MTKKPPPIEIVIAEAGFVFVGRVTMSKRFVLIEQASVIRQWGTTKGLGEIALNGPTDNTVLDPCGSVRILEDKVIAVLDQCNQFKWEKYVDE